MDRVLGTHLGGSRFGDPPVGGFGREPPVGGCILEGLCWGPTYRWGGINLPLMYPLSTPHLPPTSPNLRGG